MQTAGRSTADIHTGTFSYRFQPFQDLDLIPAIFLFRFPNYVFFRHILPSALFVFLRDPAVFNFKQPVDLYIVFHKFIQACAGNNGLDRTDPPE